MSAVPHVFDKRQVIANGSTGALTIPIDFWKANGMRPGMRCRLTLQTDGVLLIQLVAEANDVNGGSTWNVVKLDIFGLPERPHVMPAVVIEGKKVVRNGLNSPAVTVNNRLADLIDMEIHDWTIPRMYRDGSVTFQLLEKVDTGNTTRFTPLVRYIPSQNDCVPIVPSRRRQPAQRQVNGF